MQADGKIALYRSLFRGRDDIFARRWEKNREHLAGRASLGVYPILTDNTSYFLAADFDHGDWLADCMRYREEMVALGLTAYVERSRSGNGGHVWVFFEDAYPCDKSRTIGLEIARKVLGLSAFDKEASFDRLFPSQDVVTKNGLGNLIALPFQGSVARDGNTVFLDPGTNEPFEDQYRAYSQVSNDIRLTSWIRRITWLRVGRRNRRQSEISSGTHE